MNKTAFMRGYMEKTSAARWRKWMDKLVDTGKAEDATMLGLRMAQGQSDRLPMKLRGYVSEDEPWAIVKDALKKKNSPYASKRAPIDPKIFKENIKKVISENNKPIVPKAKTKRGLRRMKSDLEYDAYEREIARIQGTKKGDYWGASNKVDPEEVVDIVHSGTTPYIQSFLKGKQPGYALEAGGKGIQVHPLRNGRQLDEARINGYADMASSATGLPRGVLRGKIKAKYLDAANNGYEGGLRPENIKHLTDIKVSDY